MVDGFSYATRKPIFVSLHTSAGTGNGIGNIITAFLNKKLSTLVSGQQKRQMLVGDPLLANRGPETIVQP